MQKLVKTFGNFSTDESASPSVEFVIIAPILFGLVFSIFEAGWLMTQQSMLARGMNMAIRDLRLGREPNVTHASLKTSVCDRVVVIKDCINSINLELREVALIDAAPPGVITCVDRTDAAPIEPVLNSTGGVGKIMFVEVCIVVDPLMPGVGLGAQLPKDVSGGFRMYAYSAFINEP